MGQIKCDYCGNFFDEATPNCPSCGAVNNYYKRSATGSPRTIAELQAWYTAHHLPPENVTRFFIGKNIHEPKAFGIYKDGTRYVVYKNKADGTRAVRYEGKDEEYAVNEIYLKLKEEILNQKAHNQAQRAGGSSAYSGSAARSGSSGYSGSTSRSGSGTTRSTYSGSSSSYSGASSSRSGSNYTRSSRSARSSYGKGKLIKWGIIGGVAVFGIAAIASDPEPLRAYNYYEDSNGGLYYLDCGTTVPDEANAYNWWKYDDSTGEWYVYQKGTTTPECPDDLRPPEKMGREQNPESINLMDYLLAHGLTYDAYNDYMIQSSRAFIDAGNHKEPEKSYYRVDDALYYYLVDDYGASYGNGDNSGWYLYDDDTSAWTYYCDEDDKEALGEDLWYTAPAFAITSSDSYDFADERGLDWTTVNFDDTVWGEEYEQALNSYLDYEAAEAAKRATEDDDDDNSGWSSWDDDSDWDWDSGDDWDYDYGDWDSDW